MLYIQSLQNLLSEALGSLEHGGLELLTCRPAIEVTLTKEGQQGDFTSNLALQLASVHSLDAGDLARQIVGAIPEASFLAGIEIAQQGFINFHLDTVALGLVVSEISSAGEQFGQLVSHQSSPVRVVLAMGSHDCPTPMTFVPVLSTAKSLANLLKFRGYTVITDYYSDTHDTHSNTVINRGKDMDDFGIKIDNYLSQGEYVDSDAYWRHVLTNTSEHVIFLLSADQQEESEAIRQAAADWTERVDIVSAPSARWVGDAANCRSLRQLLETLGRDTVQFFGLSRTAGQIVELNATLAEFRQKDNPLYLVQCAHAKICSVLRRARFNGIEYNHGDRPAGFIGQVEPAEVRLLCTLAIFPEIVAAATTAREPHRLTSYLQDLANGLNKYYGADQWLTENHLERHVRLGVVVAAQQVLANGLRLIGVSAPEVL